MSILGSGIGRLTLLVLAAGMGAGHLGCAPRNPEPDAAGAAFAEIELAYEGCNCFEEVRELKVISHRLFGMLPDVDEARQILRLRIREPRTLPLLEFARAVDGTHALTRSLTLEAVVSLREGQARIEPTGQALSLGERAGTDAVPARRRLRGLGWQEPSQFRVTVIP